MRIDRYGEEPRGVRVELGGRRIGAGELLALGNYVVLEDGEWVRGF